jgi:hypothetical protein
LICGRGHGHGCYFWSSLKNFFVNRIESHSGTPLFAATSLSQLQLLPGEKEIEENALKNYEIFLFSHKNVGRKRLENDFFEYRNQRKNFELE